MTQPYRQQEPSGGFLSIVVSPENQSQPNICFEFYNEHGELLHAYCPLAE